MRILLLSALMLSTFGLSAQVAKTAAPSGPILDGKVHTSTTKLVTLHDNASYKKTAKAAKRAQKYANTFDANAHKDINFPDKTVLHLKMEKNPSYAGQSTSITPKVKTDPTVNKTQNGSPWACATNHVTLSAQSTSFMNNDYSSSASHIYPGAVYTFNDFYNGSYKEQTGARYTISLITDNPNISGSSYINVANPWMGSVLNAVRKLAGEAHGPAANESTSYQIYETDNSAAQSLLISGGASGYGITASASYGSSSSSNTVNLTIDAKKILYTVNTVPPDSGFFVDPKVENISNLMVIGSVSYGVRILANLTYTFNSSSDAAAFKASYSGWGVHANFSLSDVSKSSSVSSTINCYVVGGPGNSTISFDKKNLESEINKIFSGVTYQNAMPIDYEFYDMAGDVVGSNSATDDFSVQDCVPNNNAAKLQSVYVSFQTGQDGKDNDTHYQVSLYDTKNSNNNYNGPDIHNWGASDSDPNCMYYYATGPLNVVFNAGQKNTVQLVPNPIYPPNKLNQLTMDDFVKNGGLVHLHIWPNGNDTWDLSGMTLTLNFEGGLSQVVNFGQFVVSQNSTEMTLYFNGAFKQL